MSAREIATVVFLGLIVVLPVLLVVSTALWFKARKRARDAQAELADIRSRATTVRAALEQARGRATVAETRLAHIGDRFKNVFDLDEELARVRAQVSASESELAQQRIAYREKKAIHDRLTAEIAIFDDRLAFAEMGVYEPHFDFSDSEQYKAAIIVVRKREKEMISSKTAVFCTKEWLIEGSKAKGRTMINQNIRLTLRAFNNECEAAIANTRWNNVNAMEKRIIRAKEQIEKMNASLDIQINPEFLKSKLDELHLTHEYREKLKAEKEERAEAARVAREEQRLMRDLEKAEEDEAHYARLLARAKAEAANIVGEKLDAFSDQIEMLERDLAEAHTKAERAKALAERTRTGWIYVISNIGSFGEGVVKIGLTRRLDPQDRIRELGDASVPFTFDVHAMIYSDDAPALERALHSIFEPTRINAQNYRKEFFQADLDDVEAAVRHLAPEASFFKDIEAQEYRETLARRRQTFEQNTATEEHFPTEI